MKTVLFPDGARSVVLGLSSALLSMGAAYLVYITLENYSGLLHGLAFLVAAFLVGGLLGSLAGTKASQAIGIGAFIGALVLWSPVLLVTYGFALLFLPVLALFAGVVVLGAKVGGRWRHAIRPRQ
jgi:hypothetical protein